MISRYDPLLLIVFFNFNDLFSIQPHNIIIEQNEEGQIIAAKIVDFGTAFQLPFSPENYNKSLEGCHDPIGTSGYSGKTSISLL